MHSLGVWEALGTISDVRLHAGNIWQRFFGNDRTVVESSGSSERNFQVSASSFYEHTCRPQAKPHRLASSARRSPCTAMVSPHRQVNLARLTRTRGYGHFHTSPTRARPTGCGGRSGWGKTRPQVKLPKECGVLPKWDEQHSPRPAGRVHFSKHTTQIGGTYMYFPVLENVRHACAAQR